MENQDKVYFVSLGGGQYFKREGASVTIVSVYDFNPSIERTGFQARYIEGTHSRPCTEQEFDSAVEKVLGILGVGVPVAA
ncbi:hypothetical protein [Salmonirosea aquatica]|uniref:Uncharacterized protein n=1 Tax=Salmonirosea aquatica TaxID=2654236 RepID=A0A7C9FRS7_9BACT|nr:hypothetical protein [Cytophagaceae bacterium SJW1-29]